MVTLSEIFRQYGEEYLKEYDGRITYEQKKALFNIERCGTGDLGRAGYRCKECGEIHYVNKSCGNRHCPSCQNHKTGEWLVKQLKDLLPCDYFFYTFTLPGILRTAAQYDSNIVYKAMFKGLCYIMSLKDRQLYMLLYKSFIITYGKCFSTGKRRGLSLDAKDIFKTSPELYKLHCTLIKIRNEYVAHADDNICEFGKIYLASTSSKYQIFTPVTRFSNPINHSLQKEIDLCLFVIKKVEAKINRLERKLIKMQT